MAGNGQKRSRGSRSIVGCATLALVLAAGRAVMAGSDNRRQPGPKAFQPPAAWEYTPPRIAPEDRAGNRSVAQKDPTVVFAEGRWHVFMTIKLAGSSRTEYCSFADWDKADEAPRTILPLADSKYYCAPQVFYFRPHRRWYLIYQVGRAGKKRMDIGFSTTETISDPGSWTKARSVFGSEADDPREKGGLDYWVICDDERAYLFYTICNRRMYRMSTKLGDFPHGWGNVELALEGDIFEASHIYRLAGTGKYLNVIEANPGGRRMFMAYLADRLDGEWTPLAATRRRPFAGAVNCRPAAGVEAWTDNISHGELIRAGNDETLTVDPGDLRLVFQGVLEKQKRGLPYGRIPWRIGILTPAAKRARE